MSVKLVFLLLAAVCLHVTSGNYYGGGGYGGGFGGGAGFIGGGFGRGFGKFIFKIYTILLKIMTKQNFY